MIDLILAASLILADGFDTAEIGEVYSVSYKCGCNVCTDYYVKVSDSERSYTGASTSTLLSCGAFAGVEKVR